MEKQKGIKKMGKFSALTVATAMALSPVAGIVHAEEPVSNPDEGSTVDNSTTPEGTNSGEGNIGTGTETTNPGTQPEEPAGENPSTPPVEGKQPNQGEKPTENEQPNEGEQSGGGGEETPTNPGTGEIETPTDPNTGGQPGGTTPPTGEQPPAENTAKGLKSLTLEGISFEGGFVPDKKSYDAKVTGSTKVIRIQAEVSEPGHTLIIDGVSVEAGSGEAISSLRAGVNPIEIKVLDSEGKLVDTYTVNVNRDITEDLKAFNEKLKTDIELITLADLENIDVVLFTESSLEDVKKNLAVYQTDLNRDLTQDEIIKVAKSTGMLKWMEETLNGRDISVLQKLIEELEAGSFKISMETSFVELTKVVENYLKLKEDAEKKLATADQIKTDKAINQAFIAAYRMPDTSDRGAILLRLIDIKNDVDSKPRSFNEGRMEAQFVVDQLEVAKKILNAQTQTSEIIEIKSRLGLLKDELKVSDNTISFKVVETNNAFKVLKSVTTLIYDGAVRESFEKVVTNLEQKISEASAPAYNLREATARLAMAESSITSNNVEAAEVAVKKLTSDNKYLNAYQARIMILKNILAEVDPAKNVPEDFGGDSKENPPVDPGDNGGEKPGEKPGDNNGGNNGGGTGGSGGGGGGGSSKNRDRDNTSTKDSSVSVDKDGKAVVDKSVLDKISTPEGQKPVVKISAPENGKVSLTLSKETLKELIAKEAFVEVTSQGVLVKFNTNKLADLDNVNVDISVTPADISKVATSFKEVSKAVQVKASVSADGKTVSDSVVSVVIPRAEGKLTAKQANVYALINNEWKLVPSKTDANGNKIVTQKFGTDVVYMIGENLVSFKDVPENSYSKEAVEFMASKGIIVGTGDSKFDPKANVSGDEASMFIARSLASVAGKLGEDLELSSQDKGAAYAANAMLVELGVLNNKINLKGSINRETALIVLGRAAEKLGVKADGNLSGADFKDFAKVDTEAQKAIDFAVKAGVTVGVGDKSLGLDQNLTREQFSVMLYRILDKADQF